MTRILVLSDTHIPVTAQDLPSEIYKEIEGVDMIFHAGDFIDLTVLEKLRSLKETKAVCGNMDPKEICAVLNPKEIINIGKFKIGLVHGYGAPSEIMATVRKEFDKIDLLIFGHSHAAMNMKKDGVLYFNPGSPTDKIFASKNTYGILEITDKGIEGNIVEIKQQD
ncbi:MAG: metallophosphoesterase family protein [Candidatus Omnitrophota bacterium]|nr:metallophosphoesterase family protein [Candidatus Omnitrophota bacterium]